VRIAIPGLKALALSRNPFIELNFLGLPSYSNTRLGQRVEVQGGICKCIECGQDIGNPFGLFEIRLSRLVAKISFWGLLTIRQLTSNTRVGSALVLARSILTLVFLASILIFAQATNENRPIWFILYSFGLWVLFEVGVSRSALVLNSFKNIREDLRSSSLSVSSSAYLTNIFDLIPICVLIFGYSLIVSDLSTESFLLSVASLFLAYCLMLIPALSLSFGVAWINRNYRDFKHILPWVIRILLFTTPVFDIGYSGHLEFLRVIFEYSPLNLPFSLLEIPMHGFKILNLQMFFGFVASACVLLPIYRKRAFLSD
jgi:ABC-type polysaccharide/polyol phosphate export permease